MMIVRINENGVLNIHANFNNPTFDNFPYFIPSQLTKKNQGLIGQNLSLDISEYWKGLEFEKLIYPYNCKPCSIR